MADPDLELWGDGGGGGGLDLLALSAIFPSVISSFFTQNKGGSRAPRAPSLDPLLLLFTSRKINLDFCSAFEIRLLVESSVAFQAKTNDLFQYQTMRTTEWFDFFPESTS